MDVYTYVHKILLILQLTDIDFPKLADMDSRSDINGSKIYFSTIHNYSISFLRLKIAKYIIAKILILSHFSY